MKFPVFTFYKDLDSFRLLLWINKKFSLDLARRGTQIIKFYDYQGYVETNDPIILE